MAQTAVFVALQASISPRDRSSATSALFLIGPMATTMVMAVGSALIVAGLRSGLLVRLTALGLGAEAIQEVFSDFENYFFPLFFFLLQKEKNL